MDNIEKQIIPEFEIGKKKRKQTKKKKEPEMKKEFTIIISFENLTIEI